MPVTTGQQVWDRQFGWLTTTNSTTYVPTGTATGSLYTTNTWIDTGTTITTGYLMAGYSYPQVERQAALTQGEVWRERERVRVEADRQRYQEQVARRQLVDARAMELLMAHLDEEQKRDAIALQRFDLISDLGRCWRIRMGSIVGNVDLMPNEGGERLASYCAHGPHGLPHGDHFLIQKLALETDEMAFLRVANEHWRRGEYNDIDIPA